MSTTAVRPHEQVAGIATEPDAPEPNTGTPAHRRFVRWLLAGAVATLVLVATINYWVDPLGITGAHRFPVVENGASRDVKADLMEALDTPPDVLILGSSRVMKLDPKDFEAAGMSAFNAGVSSGKPVDFHAFAALAGRTWNDNYPRLLIAVAPETFYDSGNADGPDRTEAELVIDPRLRSSLTVADRLRGTVATYGSFADLRTLGGSIQTVYAYLTNDDARQRAQRSRALRDAPLPERAKAARFRLDGWSTYRYSVYGDLALEARVRRQVGKYLERVNPSAHAYTRMGEHHKRYFEATIRLANEHGVEPVVYFAPTHPMAMRLLQPHHEAVRTQQVKSYLDDLREDLRFRYVDLSDYRTFGADSNAFYDGIHMMEANASALARYLIDAGHVAPPEGRS